MKPLQVLLALLVSLLIQTTARADLNVLIIGSESDTGDLSFITSGTSSAFPGSGIKTQLEGILGGVTGLGTVNVTYEDRYKSYSGNYATNFASWYHWPYPAGAQESRLSNLRGEGDVQWDYVVLIGDPYTIEKQPGMYAYGVGKIAEEVAKRAGAETILLMPWPAATSSATVAHYKEVVYRTGRSGGIKVAPAALAREDAVTAGQTLDSTDENYIAAASIYSRIYEQSASTSSYTHKAGTLAGTLAGITDNTVTENIGAQQYTGQFSFQSPYQWYYRSDRKVHAGKSAGGTSTEDYLVDEANASLLRAKVMGVGRTEGQRFYVGRDSGYSLGEKDYRNLGYNVRMFGYRFQSGGSDQQRAAILGEGVDLADQMISESDSFRVLPHRLLWAQILSAMPASATDTDGDGTPDNRPISGGHMNPYIRDAGGAYMYTLFSGRCPLDPMPIDDSELEVMNWKSDMIGYETAWKVASCQTRAPGFKVMPSSVDRLSIDANTTETMTVQFLLPPQSNVTVTITLAGANQVLIDTNSLTFTPENYATPQMVTITNPGSDIAENDFDIQFSTSSQDPVYDGLYDSWRYTEVGSFIQPENPYYTVPGVEWELFNGAPNYSGLDALTPDATGIKSSLTVAPPGQQSTGEFAVRFTGYLDVPVTGVYSFTTESTGHISLYLGDTLVASNTQNAVPRTEEAAIAAGTHAMTVLYWYDNFRSPEINLLWEVPGDIIRNIPDSALSRIPPNSAPVASDLEITALDYPGAKGIDLIATDIDNPESDLVYTVLTEPASGILWVGSGANLSYTAEAGYVGVVSFTYKASDGELDSNIATGTITVGEPPVADAGENQTVRDNDDNGSVEVVLDGSGSSDSNGTIVSYVWHDGVSNIATNDTATANVTLPLGTHTITLTVTDNEGGMDTDTVVITVEGPNTTPVVSAGTNRFAVLEESAPGAPVPLVSGGTVIDYALNGISYTTHTFTSSGTLTVSNGGDVEYLIVGGGGGGGDGHNSNGRRGGGGGGAGGLLTNVDGSMLAVTDGAYNVVVGSGGAAGATEKSGSNGSNSSFGGPGMTSITAVGGGGGAGVWNHPSGAGGSGGGASSDVHTPGNGTAGQGNAGGLGTTSGGSSNRGGGGGGAGEAGSTDANGYGGDGVQNSITGTDIWYAGGGAGGAANLDGPTTDRIGGEGGGGNSRQAGTDGLGGGGGGGHYGRTAGAGGSGIVIVRYATGTNVEVQFDDATAIDPDGDDLDVFWEVVSTDPPGLPDPIFSGDVTLGTAAAIFTAVGTYELRLTADDTLDTHSDTVTITIDPPLPANYATWANGDNFANPFTNTALGADPDGDGLSSLLEFAFGTDPTANDSRFMAADGSPHGQPMAASDGSGMWLYYLRRTDHGTAGSITYSTEFSADLGSFSASSAGLVPADVQNANPGYQVMKIPYPTGKRFGRVAVEATPE